MSKKQSITSKFSIILLCLIAHTALLTAQIKIPTCPLDSVNFTKSYQRKQWFMDTLQMKDFENRTNYLSALHRNYLPMHKSLKNEVKQRLNSGESTQLYSLDSVYLKELSAKRNVFLGGTPGFNENLPIFTHLNFVVIFETLGFYPDIYAVCFNSIQSPPATLAFVNEKIESIYSSTKPKFQEKTEKEFRLFLNGIQSLQEKEHCGPLWQGALSPEEREKYDWINFLIWCNRKY